MEQTRNDTVEWYGGGHPGGLHRTEYNFRSTIASKPNELLACEQYEFARSSRSIRRIVKSLQDFGISVSSAYPGAQFLPGAIPTSADARFTPFAEYTASYIILEFKSPLGPHKIEFFAPLHRDPKQFLALIVTLAEFHGFPATPWEQIKGKEEWKQKLAAIAEYKKVPHPLCPPLLVKGDVETSVSIYLGASRTALSLPQPESRRAFWYTPDDYDLQVDEVNRAWEDNWRTTFFAGTRQQKRSAKEHLNQLGAVRLLGSKREPSVTKLLSPLGKYESRRDRLKAYASAIEFFYYNFATELWESPLGAACPAR